MSALPPERRLPLAGLRVLDYSQYVAGPLATMLLADLGADVVKVEPPHGDAWRRYEPLAAGESRFFYALNRNKRSVVLDLKTAGGRTASEALVRSADALVHNLTPARALAFGLDPAAVAAASPGTVVVNVSAFGGDGPDAHRLGYDLVAQAMSGLLLADAHPHDAVPRDDAVPRRAGGIPIADLVAGLLAAVSAASALVGRVRTRGGEGEFGSAFEVSLLGAGLLAQVQRFVRVAGVDDLAPDVAEPDAGTRGDSVGAGLAAAGPGDLVALASQVRDAEALEPYYGCYRAADGYVALACLDAPQRARLGAALGIDDPWYLDPQAPPADDAERAGRLLVKGRFAAAFAQQPVAHWCAALAALGVPAGEVRALDSLFDHPQALLNGLVQVVSQPGVGDVRLLGRVTRAHDVAAAPAGRPAPGLGAHTAEVLDALAAEAAR